MHGAKLPLRGSTHIAVSGSQQLTSSGGCCIDVEEGLRVQVRDAAVGELHIGLRCINGGDWHRVAGVQQDIHLVVGKGILPGLCNGRAPCSRRVLGTLICICVARSLLAELIVTCNTSTVSCQRLTAPRQASPHCMQSTVFTQAKF